MSTEFGPGPIAPRFSAGVPAEKYRPSVPAPDSDHTLKAVRPGLQIVRRQRVDQLGSESWASRQYSATKAIKISGKVMAYAALNSRNAGFSIIVTRLLRSTTTSCLLQIGYPMAVAGRPIPVPRLSL
jgi:hypothetical protein